jgi:Cof subfamily protein (haloacid dehalogenase superfamily)
MWARRSGAQERRAANERGVIKLIGIDVDGTLLDSRGRVPSENLGALQDAASRGVRLAIVTGRSFLFALPAVQALPDPLTLIVHNGAIARTRGGETLIRRLLPLDTAREVLAATSAWRDCAVVLFDRPQQGQMVYDRMDWTHPNRARFHARNRAIIEEVASLEDALIEDPIQVAYNGGVADMRCVIAALEPHAAEGRLSLSVTEYAPRDFSLVDVCSPGTTKGATLAALAASFGLDRSEVLAIGDNYNDREMLEWAGVGVVMGNATEDLRAAGFHVTGTNDEAGLAQAVRRFAS